MLWYHEVTNDYPENKIDSRRMVELNNLDSAGAGRKVFFLQTICVKAKNIVASGGKSKLIHRSLLFLIFFSMVLSACIEEYDPKINDYEKLLVIDGCIIKGDSIQKILISRSTNYSESAFNPLSACLVSVKDDKGNEFIFEEDEEGVYCAAIPQQFLEYNSEFQLHVRTPDNEEYESEFEPLLKNSMIDSVYYEVESYQSSSEESDIGLQFYADLLAPESATKNYGWIVEETWELQTNYSIDGYWQKGDFDFPVFNPVSDSVSMCWSTKPVREVFVASTENLTVNEKKKIPLHYVPAGSTKLNIRYSALIKQFPLSNKAYQFLKLNNIATQESGGLYQSQPAQSLSNIKNVNNSAEHVLGYFWASSYSERRIFFDGPLTRRHYDCNFMECYPPCNLMERLLGSGRDVVFLVAVEFTPGFPDSVRIWGYPYNQICIDCTDEGGVLVKPDFFKKDYENKK